MGAAGHAAVPQGAAARDCGVAPCPCPVPMAATDLASQCEGFDAAASTADCRVARARSGSAAFDDDSDGKNESTSTPT